MNGAKILLVGPCPPPWGGISVHVATACRRLTAEGWRCRVVDAALPPPSLLARVGRAARRGWTVHLHTHGHSARAWLAALACALAAKRAPARLLTLHSGLLPEFVAGASAPVRTLVRATLARFDRVIAVGPAIRAALAPLAAVAGRLELLPAYLQTEPGSAELPATAASWLAAAGPRLVATLSFRPEYGLEVLAAAIARLERSFPGLSCLLLGGGSAKEIAEAEAELARRRVAGRFVVAGEVEHDQCLALLARTDLFVRPTLADGDSISVREALAAGVPVVATAVGTRPEGCRLVAAGDDAALAAAIAGVVAAAEAAPALRPARATAASDGLERLLRIYGDLRLEGAR